MSDLHVSLTQKEMEENGEMDFIRAHVAAAAQGDQTPAPVADTVEAQEGTPEAGEEAAEEVVAPDSEGTTEEDRSDDDTVWLDLDEDTERLLNEKYNGDLNAMLRAAREGQSVIGRQGNELGALRAQMEAMEERIQQGLQAAQPYAEWPDEFADSPEQAAALRVIAEQAFDRRDPETFDRAIKAWHEADPVSAGLYRDLKEMQVRQMQLQQAPVEDEATLEATITDVVSEFPQFQVESFQAEVAAELDKTPSLKAVLWGQVPGVSVEERATILREAAQRVVQRTTSETAQAARKRIAVRTSEEARQARVAAQVARASTAREVPVETEGRKVAMGDTGRTLDIDRLNAMLPEGDRI